MVEIKIDAKSENEKIAGKLLCPGAEVEIFGVTLRVVSLAVDMETGVKTFGLIDVHAESGYSDG